MWLGRAGGRAPAEPLPQTGLFEVASNRVYRMPTASPGLAFLPALAIEQFVRGYASGLLALPEENSGHGFPQHDAEL